jgi:hypothetical protein
MVQERKYKLELDRISEIAWLATGELRTAIIKHPPINSAHEGYAVILEEVDELKEEVWKQTKNRDINHMRKEAIQVAAMAMRFILDVCDKE